MDSILTLASDYFKELSFKNLSLENIPVFHIVIGALIFLAVIALFRSGRPAPKPASKPGREMDIFTCRNVIYQPLALMSRTEANFWRLLRKALPGYHIFPQIATSALLTVQTDNKEHFGNILRKFESTRVDFVVCDHQLAVLALIELDDQSHDPKKDRDRERDFITSKAGYRTVRFDCRNWPDVACVRQRLGLSSELPPLPPAVPPGRASYF